MPETASESQPKYSPSITDLISLAVPIDEVQPELSPDGSKVAYAVRTANWNRDQYEALCYVYDIKREAAFQITRSGEVTQVHWINKDSLALLKGDPSDEKQKPQVWLFENLMGEGMQITDHKTGVKSFKPFASGIVYLAENPERKENKKRTDEYGSFTHFEQEESASALYYTNIAKLKDYNKRFKGVAEDEAKKLVKPTVELSKKLEKPLTILDFFCSPLNDAIFLNCQPKDYEVYFEETSSYRLKLDPDGLLDEFMRREREKAEGDLSRRKRDEPSDLFEDVSYMGELTQILLPKGAFIARVSPQGNKLLISHNERDNMMYTQSDLWILDLAQGRPETGSGKDAPVVLKKISQHLDREPHQTTWVSSGIFVSYVDGTKIRIARLSETGAIEILDLEGVSPWSFHFSEGGSLACVGTSERLFREVFVSTHSIASSGWEMKQLTQFSRDLENWNLGTVETIRWKSKDGVEIEGVLRKPLDFDPNKKYPLVFVVHGGPMWFSGEFLLGDQDVQYYPGVQFVHKGILVLKPNYRGSIGRGQAFKELNRNNLGIGDLWDLESAIDHLDSRGFINKTKVGCMGWSQGGYISAFAGIHSDKFSAVSVGAGASDWYTYHITNDIPFFTTQYLSSSPFRDRTLYVKTAPMSKIQEAKTPTLIQHGSKDQRVPLANATELYRGLKEMKVPVELFVYPDMAHPITKPRENRALMHQNLTWFSHYLLGEELDYRLATTQS